MTQKDTLSEFLNWLTDKDEFSDWLSDQLRDYHFEQVQYEPVICPECNEGIVVSGKEKCYDCINKGTINRGFGGGWSPWKTGIANEDN